ncbi:hypothetical protein F4808DRAFT_449647 [Astrocystis sublimbata]|nr:hypothetical protein F4808DRAFT_449647 [Astrocystis sublimbata]
MVVAEGDDDTPMQDPKRRFAPQLVEHTTKSSASKRQHQETPSKAKADAISIGITNSQPHSPPNTATGSDRPIPSAAPKTRDASTQANADIDLPAPRLPSKPVRRFAPVPIETTFDSYRVTNRNPHGPAPEPTPDPSPTSSHSSLTFSSTAAPMASEEAQEKPPENKPKPKRRFTPQLIETTKRAWRAGQEGPASKPIDKTDITPGTNHIYAPKPKRTNGARGAHWPGKSSTGLAHAAGSARDDDEALERFLSPRRQRPINARPNTRRGTRTSSYQPELDTILSSESGNSSESDDGGAAAGSALNAKDPALSENNRNDPGDVWSTRSYDLTSRRESCDEEFSGYLLGIAAREAQRQREFEQALAAFPNALPPQGVEHFLARDNSDDDVQIGVGDDEPPLRHGPSQLLRRTSTDPGWAVKEMRAHAEKLALERVETGMSLDEQSDEPSTPAAPVNALWTPPVRRESRDSAIGSSMGPIIIPHSPKLFAKSPSGHDKPFTPPPSAGKGLRAGPFDIPFAFRNDGPEDGDLRQMRKAASPPMLGKDITFRTCPSPQSTRMEPNQPYSHFDRIEKKQRDTSGVTGLWRGYCSSNSNNKPETPSLQPINLLHTPGASWSSNDPFASAFGASVQGSGTQSPATSSNRDKTSLHRKTLSGLDERLLKEKIRKEREELLQAEFDDAFVTQVYNYLSLGYAATARDFDDELSKISGISIPELRKNDHVAIEKGFMLEMEIASDGSNSDSSSTDSSEDERMATSPLSPDHGIGKMSPHKPIRWKALKLYVREWARQHPSFGGDDCGTPAWGVRARRGSWAI